MQVTPEPNDKGQRGKIVWLDPENRVRTWFRDAFEQSGIIETGVDTLNQCVRFRKVFRDPDLSDNRWESLQYSFRNNLWTVLDNDYGTVLVRARAVADDADPEERLYSAEYTGGIFELNTRDLDWPYSGATVQDTLSADYTITTSSLTKTGAFSADMLGEVIRIVSPGTARDGAISYIYEASANAISFLPVITGLANGDEFLIGAVKYLIRSAPLTPGAIRDNTKTMHDVRIRALPGARTEDDESAPAGVIKTRTYRNLSDTAEDETSEIAIYGEDSTVAKMDEDRVSSVEGQGSSLQIEIEHLHTRSDFRIATAAIVVREETSQVNDQSSSA